MAGKSKKSLLGQFYQRKVMRVGLAYILVGWLLMQIGEVTFEALTLPPWALSFLIAVIVLGFPIALILAWAFEVTPEGIVKDPADTADEPNSGNAGLDFTTPSVAVLPFDDMSEHGDQSYFCEGIAEEILNSLCKVAGLRVASRVASFRFGGKRADISEIARKLKVQTVLEGSVRQFGEHIRVTAQLINAEDGFHLWTRQYDRQREDLFDIQEDIANRIVSALSLTLKHSHLREQHEVVPRAYDFFLRGRQYFDKHNSQDAKYAALMFRRAVEADPSYGRAWAWLAFTQGFSYMYFEADSIHRQEALGATRKALVLAPHLPESHIAAGIAHCMKYECSLAAQAFEKALEIDPKKYEAWYFFARTRIRQGRPHEALKLLQKASRVRPEDYQSVLLQAQLHVSMGDSEQAIEASREGLEKVQAILEFNPDDTRALNLGAPALLRLGQTEKADRWMMASLERAPKDPIVLYNAACYYSMAGEQEKAFDCLEKCYLRAGTINPDWLKNDSDLDNIRGMERFIRLLPDDSEKLQCEQVPTK
jgi:TolB-like protein/tetratricopeptide (TPR) repeat protein